jgi:hypothetical protein
VFGVLNRFLSPRGEKFVVDLYASPAGDPSGFGEGQDYLGTAVVAPAPDLDGDGFSDSDTVFSFVTDRTDLAGWAVTATATRMATGDTSEFSAWIPVK